MSTADAKLDLVRSIYADWERGDLRRADWAHPEIELVICEGPDPASAVGLAAVGRLLRDQLSPLADLTVVAEGIRELDQERILVFERHSGRGKSSGVEIQAEHMHVFHVHDGKVTRLVAYYDRDRARRALRLPNEQGAR